MDLLRHALLGCLVVLLGLWGSGAARGGEEDEEGGRYGETPEHLLPYRELGEPYQRFFTEPPEYRGPGADAPDPEGLAEVRLGLLVPMEGPDVALGKRLQNGVYRERLPYRVLVRDEAQAWGAAANAIVELVFDHGVWGVIGALEDANTHVVTRVILKAEVPVVNTSGPDPTLTEHMIPWLVRVRPDDRQTSYRLAKRIFEEDGHERVAVFRANDRYGRTGTIEFKDAARRLHHPILVEMRYENHSTSYAHQIGRLRDARPDAIVLWGRAEASGRALRALRAAGLEQPVYGPDRLVDPVFLEAAGSAAEGVVFTYPFDPTSDAPAWRGFTERYRARFRTEPDAVAAYAYDGTAYLLEAIEDVGLNRVRIQRRLFEHMELDGVTGKIRFDVTHNNITPVVVGHVRNGAFHFD
ncbi:MAG: ABC transporter substrate-binding protein [Planctomycetota bacterium]|jgi:ABC-type branched-subunit amino acid transport system substrate-binding protein